MSHFLKLGGTLLAATWFAAVAASACAQDPIDFVRDVRPILVDHCYQCHGPDAAHRKGHLRLDRASGATARLPSGKKAIVPGDLAASELWRRIHAADPDVRMPPAEGKPLTTAQKETLKRWIESGAKWPEHWSLVPPRRAPLPQLPGLLRNWPHNSIDLFIGRRLVAENLSPSPEADLLTLLRRASLDLTGIGPSPAEIERRLADGSPDAYEQAVDRLLASPRYGERMASDWLDAARYADTHGYHSDSQRDMWRWRQWVIDALNADMPFDQFTVWQLAGDLLPKATLEQRIATGFNRNHMLNDENGAIPEEYLCEYVSDRVTTTATVWLGLTIGCARCHDHKYDPISQRDFYRLYAFFNNVPENGLGGRSGNAPPLIVAPTRLVQQELDQLAACRSRLEATLKERERAANKDQVAWEAGALAAGPLGRPPQDAAVHLSLDDVPQAVSGIHLKGKNPSFVGGKFGQALLGDGDSFVEIPRSALRPGGQIDRDDPLTVSLWVFATTGDRTSLVSAVDETLSDRGLELARIDERIVFRLTHVPEQDELLVRTADKLPARKWRHVAVTYDGSGKAGGVSVYVDGQKRPLETIHDSLVGHIATDQPLRIGRGDSETFFRGMLDEVQLFPRALSAAELALLAGGNPIQELLRRPASERTAEQRAALRQYYLENFDTAYQGLQAELIQVRQRETKLRQAAPTVMVMQEMPQPRDTFVLQRGRYDQPVEKVAAGTPEILPPLASDLPRNRLGLARWLVRPDHPLTARVTVNRFWQTLFGTGLVKTADDFGVRGERPSHPELLDWLACEFQGAEFGARGSEDGGDAWDVKRLLRRMVTSAAYRQASRVTPELLARDKDNRLLARGPRLRLSAEAIRDNALAAAGLLDERVGGVSVRPYQPADLWKELAYDPLEYTAQTYVPSTGADLYRRSLYTFRKRTVPPPAMALLDATDRETCTVTHSRTNTPQQSLVVLNDITYVEAARHVAERAVRDAADDQARLQRLYMLVLARPPRPGETALLADQLFTERQSFRSDPAAAKALLAVGQSPTSPDVDAAELAAWTTVASVLLNLDEALTNH